MSCDTKRKDITLRLLRRGWTTAMQSALAGGYLSLSQRVGGWVREGMPIAKRWVIADSGAKVMAYKISRAKKAA